MEAAARDQGFDAKSVSLRYNAKRRPDAPAAAATAPDGEAGSEEEAMLNHRSLRPWIVVILTLRIKIIRR